MLWNCSQVTKAIPNTVPACSPPQIQPFTGAPNQTAPSVSTTANPTTPMKEFGNPNASDCGDAMTLLQLTQTLKSHAKTESLPAILSCNCWTLSTERMNEASSPTAPVTISRRAGACR